MVGQHCLFSWRATEFVSKSFSSLSCKQKIGHLGMLCIFPYGVAVHVVPNDNSVEGFTHRWPTSQQMSWWKHEEIAGVAHSCVKIPAPRSARFVPLLSCDRSRVLAVCRDSMKAASTRFAFALSCGGTEWTKVCIWPNSVRLQDLLPILTRLRCYWLVCSSRCKPLSASRPIQAFLLCNRRIWKGQVKDLPKAFFLPNWLLVSTSYSKTLQDLVREMTNAKQSDRLGNMCCEFMVLSSCAMLCI